MLYQLSYFRIYTTDRISRPKVVTTPWAVMDSNHRRLTPAELQSAPFGHSGNCPFESFACTATPLENPQTGRWHHKLGANIRTILETPKLLGELSSPK